MRRKQEEEKEALRKKREEEEVRPLFIPPSSIDFIHDARHLCTRSRTDGIKAMSRGFSGGEQVKKTCQWKKSRLSLFILDNRK